MCDHKFELLDVEKSKKSYRWSNVYKRTTRFFCIKCTDIKETSEQIETTNNQERPDWTYNI